MKGQTICISVLRIYFPLMEQKRSKQGSNVFASSGMRVEEQQHDHSRIPSTVNSKVSFRRNWLLPELRTVVSIIPRVCPGSKWWAFQSRPFRGHQAKEEVKFVLGVPIRICSDLNSCALISFSTDIIVQHARVCTCVVLAGCCSAKKSQEQGN